MTHGEHVIINISRAKAFQQCRQYAYNWDELRLVSHREADPLVIGEGYHLGSEVVSQSADVNEAIAATEKRMRERYAKSTILPEELPNIERNIEWAKHAVAQWAENYDKADFRVLWPEVKGIVELPGTEHHCWFAHRKLYPDVPFERCSAVGPEGRADLGNVSMPCVQPHRLAFRTDGVIEMYKNIWLLEQKTTSSTSRNNFWKKFTLDIQVRGYVYGVWKVTGVLVSGVLVNAIIKHQKQTTKNGEKKYQLDPTNVGFEREPILVTKDDLGQFETDIIKIADDYETSFRTGNIYKNTNSCFNYNRECYYFDKCRRGGAEVEGEFRPRDPDYVEEGYYDVLGLPNPNLVKEITPCPTQTTVATATNTSTNQPSPSTNTAPTVEKSL
jgi:hypothetical protein